MRIANVLAMIALLFCVSIAHTQEPSSPYIPPPTFMQEIQTDKPLADAMTTMYTSGNQVTFRSTIEKLAASGDTSAQILLAGAYTPRECTFLPFKTAPDDCPKDPNPPNQFGVTPSFELAIHWLKLASDHGNGEATEMLAQLTERAIRSSAISNASMADVAQLHDLARSQGFDLQDVEYTCYSLEPNHTVDTLTLAVNTPQDAILSAQQLAQLHAAGVSGTLRWRLISTQPSMNVALSHPEGPKVHMRIIVSSTITHRETVLMPNRVDIIYLQRADNVVTFPYTYSTITRSISFRPPDGNERGGAFFQSIDGSFTNICPSPTSP